MPDGSELAQAGALLALGRPAQARERVAELLGREPGNAAALCLLARAYQQEDDFAGMRDAAARAVEADPDGYDGHLLLAFALNGLDDNAAAVRHARAAIQLDPHDWRGHSALALVSVNLIGHRRRAFRSARAATRLAPEAAGAHFVRAQLFHGIGWNVPARRAYHRALALEPQHRQALTGLARLRVTRGSLRSAAGHLSALLAAAPADHAARTELDRLVLGGLAGWALVAVWVAGGLGGFAGLAAAPWLAPFPVLLLAVVGALIWRSARALSPGLRAYARRLLRADPRGRTRMAALALCAATGVAFTVAGVAHGRPVDPPVVAVLAGGAHALALVFAVIAIAVADRRVAGPPHATGAPADPDRPTDLLAERRAQSGAGWWLWRMFRAGSVLTVVPWLMGIDPATAWGTRAVAGAVALVLFVAHAEFARRRLFRRPPPPNALLGSLLVPLTLAVLAELAVLGCVLALPPRAMPLPAVLAAPALVAIVAGLLLWAGWLPYLAVRTARRALRTSPRRG